MNEVVITEYTQNHKEDNYSGALATNAMKQRGYFTAIANTQTE